MHVGCAMVPARSTIAVATSSLPVTVTAMETSPTPWAFVAVIVRPMPTAMACATTWTTVWAQWMNAAFAMGLAQPGIADAMTSLMAHVIAMETYWMPWACAAEVAQPMPTAMACATMWMTASARWMHAAFAMVLARFTIADVMSSLLAIAIAMATSSTPWAYAVAIALPMPIRTAFATT